ncbi:hypothetical protein [Paenarthrobacter sp. TA1.8]|uniref:hypothetical protein n=1 Tax=Paenarthrobacter sp. TA1.8 TaxID=3400219 RepID=UPI003B430D25
MSEQQGLPGDNTQKDRDTFTGPPRWVKVSAIVAGVLLLVVVAVMLLSGGEHGPGRHGIGIGSPESSTSAPAATGTGHAPTLTAQL